VAAARLVTDVSQTKLLFALNPGEIVPEYRAKSSRNRERDQIGMLGDIIADSRATSQKTQRWREADSNRRSLSQNEPVSLAERECRRGERAISKARSILGETEGSNPISSGSQSVSLVPSAATGTKGPAFAANVSLDETRERDMLASNRLTLAFFL
jgi:hypothetical protein